MSATRTPGRTTGLALLALRAVQMSARSISRSDRGVAAYSSGGRPQPPKNRVLSPRKDPHENNIGPSESVGAKWSACSPRARDPLG